MKQEIGKPQFTSIYDYDVRIERTYKIIEKETSKENVELIKKLLHSMNTGEFRDIHDELLTKTLENEKLVKSFEMKLTDLKIRKIPV